MSNIWRQTKPPARIGKKIGEFSILSCCLAQKNRRCGGEVNKNLQREAMVKWRQRPRIWASRSTCLVVVWPWVFIVGGGERVVTSPWGACDPAAYSGNAALDRGWGQSDRTRTLNPMTRTVHSPLTIWQSADFLSFLLICFYNEKTHSYSISRHRSDTRESHCSAVERRGTTAERRASRSLLLVRSRGPATLAPPRGPQRALSTAHPARISRGKTSPRVKTNFFKPF